MELQDLLCGMTIDRLRNLEFLRPRSWYSLPSLPSIQMPRPSMPNIQMPSYLSNIQMPAIHAPKLTPMWSNLRLLLESQDLQKPTKRHLPVPTGPYTVGCIDLMSDHTVQGVFVRLYYPTHTTDIFKREAQWPLWLPRKKYGKGYAWFRRRNTKVFGTLLNIIGGDVYVPVLWQAPVLNEGRAYPLVIFSHGLGGNRTTYTTVCSDLASYGFIVAALEHRDGTASMTYCLKPSMSTADFDPEYRFMYRNYSFQEEHWLKYERQKVEDDFDVRNKQVHQRQEEVSRVLDVFIDINNGVKVENVIDSHFDSTQLKGLIDLERVVIAGHSFGGGTTICTLTKDPRFKVGVGLDSWVMPCEQEMFSKVTQPILMVNSETFQWPSNVRNMLRLKVNADDGDRGHHVLITVKGTCHQTCSDFQYLIPSKVARMMLMRYTLESDIAMDINNRALRSFLAKHLNIPNLEISEDILTGKHPSVVYGTTLDPNGPDPECPGSTG